MRSELRNNDILPFSKKVWIATAIVGLFVILVWILKATFNVLLLILAGVLIALYFHGLSNLINRKLSIPKKASLLTSIIGSFVLIVLFLWFAGDMIQDQVSQLKDTFPAAFENFREKVNISTIGKEVLDRITVRELAYQLNF